MNRLHVSLGLIDQKIKLRDMYSKTWPDMAYSSLSFWPSRHQIYRYQFDFDFKYFSGFRYTGTLQWLKIEGAMPKTGGHNT